MNDQDVLIAFIRDEIAKEKKRQKTILIVGSLFVLIGFSYLWFLVAKPFEEVVLNPNNLAQAAVIQFDQTFEDSLVTLEASIIANGHMLAERSSTEVESAISLIGEAGIHYINTLPHELDLLQERSEAMIQLYFERNRTELQAFFKENGKEKFLSHITEDLFDKIVEDIDSHYSRGDFSFRDVDRMSRTYILEVGQSLKALSQKSRAGLTEGEGMQRKLIVAWVRMLSSQLKVPLLADGH